MSDPKPEFDWRTVLDKAVELQEMLADGFTVERPMSGMILSDIRHYRLIAESAFEAMDSVIENINIWLECLDDHEKSLIQSHSMNM